VIGKIKGLLEWKSTHQALIDVNGLCYEVEVPLSTAFSLPAVGAPVELFTHLVVREDAQLLFGFDRQGDRDTFRVLIRVNGVGPKLGVSILSGLSSNDLAACVENGDVSVLVKLPGIGKKTAERLLIELRDKLKVSGDESQSAKAGSAASPITVRADAEAESALIALGYKPVDAAKVVKRHYDETLSVEELIKLCLKAMM
jgi:holliday junction DNA helicase RuvA